MQPIYRHQHIACLLVILGLPSFCHANANKLAISPSNPKQLSNSSLQFTATFGKLDVTKLVNWTSSNATIATIATGGKATLLTSGSTTITATLLFWKTSTTLNATTAAAPAFGVQPGDTNVSAAIDGSSGGVKVVMLDNLGDPLPSQSVTVSIGTNPPGTGTLSGTITQTTDSTGTATFPDLKIDWLGTGYTLVATASPSSGIVSGTSAAFNELRVGDICLGPDTPSCNGTCADADSDALNDAWEIAGGVDLNGDGVITDSTHDLLLTGANPNQPDIFLQYDWMDYAQPGNACSVDSDCDNAHLGLGHSGETCTGPQLIPTAPSSCRYACNVDADCTGRGPSHAGELCQANSCVHTHDPSVTAPDALQAVVDRFAAHGINLHLLRGKAQPHSTVLSFRVLSDPQFPNDVITDACEGGSLASGDAGMGKYVESFYDLKQNSSPDKLNIAYHYTIFGHYNSCDSTKDCNACPQSYNPDGSPKAEPTPGASGIAEISGNDFIVSLGNRVVDLGIPYTTMAEGGTFMHELGHNLGLHHGGGIDEPCEDQSQCRVGSCTQTQDGKFCLVSDETNGKPNFLSVMNYRFQFAGILEAVAVGSTQTTSCSTDVDCPSGLCCSAPAGSGGSCSRLDYSNQTLPTGGNTPGALEERNTNGLPGLNEPAGLGSGTADLTNFFDSYCDVPFSVAPTDGPVDWSGNNDFTETNVSADLNAGFDHACGTIFSRLGGSTDWPELSGLNFTYAFQCTPYGGPGGDTAKRGKTRPKSPLANLTGGELSSQMAMDAHVLFPPVSASIMISPNCSTPNIAVGQTGTIQVALLAGHNFDVAQVDLSSLKFASAPPLSVTTSDVNADGIPDLILSFDQSKLKLTAHSTTGHLSGWMKNSQAFFGEQQIHVVSSLSELKSACP